MAPKPFAGTFTQQEPLGEAAIAAAIRVLESGRLHRYNTVAGETAEAALFEVEFAAFQGVDYCLACASGGSGAHCSGVSAFAGSSTRRRVWMCWARRPLIPAGHRCFFAPRRS